MAQANAASQRNMLTASDTIRCCLANRERYFSLERMKANAGSHDRRRLFRPLIRDHHSKLEREIPVPPAMRTLLTRMAQTFSLAP